VKALKPTCFEDIIAAGALYRPGPLKQKLPGTDTTMVELYIERKHGRRKVEYPHPKLEPILKETYGVIVYQEQVMQISQVLAGYSLGRADLLRRAMGKKKKEVMEKERAGFMEGCQKSGVDSKIAAEVFDGMEKFAEYGFNKSHSAAYGLLTVQTAWLKAHYPVEFMAALISSEASNTDKVVAHISEARQSGIEVLPPDVNESQAAFSALTAKAQPDEAGPERRGAAGGQHSPAPIDAGPERRGVVGGQHPPAPKSGKGRIRFGLGAVKGVGEAAVQAILAARADGGPFQGLFDFAERVDARKINKKVVEALLKCGAFDFEGIARWKLFHGLDAAFAAGSSAQSDRLTGQKSLFAGPKAASETKPRYPEVGETVGDLRVEEWPERVRLSFEKEALGFYLTGHPLSGHEREVRRYASCTCAQVAGKRQDDKVTVVGVVASLREKTNKEKGTRFGFFTLEDLTGTAEVICWGSRPAQGQRPKQKGWSDWEEILKRDEPIVVHGQIRMNARDDQHQRAEITASDVQLLSEVRRQKTSEVVLRIDAENLTGERAQQLKALLGRFRGTSAVTLRAIVPRETETSIRLPFKVDPSDGFLDSSRGLGFEIELR
ncbi:MAG TPA: OB-fold nucleic acid binding domain-containing protein, partial [Anaeromyxobacteraceae bacterium]|nr:OB-fold nucleic acid binding domain-containing protein [Anaeromyxobacteraceae bacterium]